MKFSKEKGMNLKERIELLEGKKNLLNEQVEKAETLKVQLKSITVEDEGFEKLSNDAENLLNEINSLKAEIEEEENAIQEEEKRLEEVNKKAEQNNNKNKGANRMNYLESRESLKDFAEILKGGFNGKEVKEKWMAKLEEKGVTPDNALLPGAVVSAINNALSTDGAEIFATFNHTGLTMFKNALDTTSDGTERAHGHKKGQSKAEEVITLAAKEVRAQYVYKYLTVDKEIIREQKDTGALIEYILKEMPQKIFNEISRAALVGDGRNTNANDKINKFEAVASASSIYTTSINATSNLYEDLVGIVGSLKAQGKKYLAISTTTLTALKLSKDGSGAYIFPVGTDIAAALGVEKIFTPDFMDEVADTITAVAYVGASYVTVGDKVLDSYEGFLLSQNKEEFLMEIYSGGALVDAHSGAVLKIVA